MASAKPRLIMPVLELPSPANTRVIESAITVAMLFPNFAMRTAITTAPTVAPRLISPFLTVNTGATS